MGAYTGATGSGTFQAQTGDTAADDTVLVDGTITITTQPSSSSVAAPGTMVFSVIAALAGAGSLTYQWQVAESTANTVFTNVSRGSGGTTASYTTGVTQVAPSASVDSNGDKYRCVVSSTGSTSVTSNAVTLTVTA